MSTGVSNKGFFWEIKDANSVVVGHLLGTVHSCSSALLNERMRSCFGDATVVAVELTDMLDPSIRGELQTALSEQEPDERAQLEKNLSWVSLPFYDPLMRPEEDLLVRKIVGAYRTYSTGYGTPHVMDRELMLEAVSGGQHVEALEYFKLASCGKLQTVVDYLTYTEGLQERMAAVKARVDSRCSITAERISHWCDVWARGSDEAVMETLSTQSVEAQKNSEERNRHMARNLACIIEKLQREKLGTVFCAVGVAHTLEANSIQHYLQTEYHFTAHRKW